MLFGRATPKPFLKKIRDVLWPRMGWKRTWLYTHHRLGRMVDTTRALSGGLATGASISFVPLPGTHLLQAFCFAFALNFNKTASMVGTIVGNPWTFPLMWGLSYNVGVQVFRFFGVENHEPMPAFFDIMGLWNRFIDNPLDIFVPWVTGGYILALGSWFLFYWAFYTLITNAKAARRGMKVRKIRKAARDMMEP